MKKCKRPRMTKNQKRDSYEIPKDCEEEIQRSCEFVRKLKDFGDKRIFSKFVEAMKSYQSKSISYIDLKTKVDFILRNHDVLLQDFNQLLSDLATTEDKKNRNPKKSDVERTVEFLNKLEALGQGLHGAFLNQLASGDDIPTLVSQLDSILRDHTSLKKEFRTFLIDSGLLKEYEYVTPSYMLRPEFEEVSSSDLNGSYVSVGHACNNKRPKEESEQLIEMLKNDMYLKALDSVRVFGNSDLLNAKPPVGFKEVVRRFYKDRDERVPPGFFKADPKLAVQVILPRLRSTVINISMEKTIKVIKTFVENHVNN